MDLIQAIEKRHSTRNFSDKFPDGEILKQIINLAYKIPSAGNLQPIELFLVYFDKPPVYFVICADFKKTTVKYGARGRNYVYMEAGHTAQNICLVCEALGLGSCCVGAFDEVEVKQRFKLEFNPIYMVAVGYPLYENSILCSG
jgi:nitroreductase